MKVAAQRAARCFRLAPKGHDAHGRSGFQIHGNNVKNDASRGCIIMDFPVRIRDPENAEEGFRASKLPRRPRAAVA